jgi:hypothetical protein
MFGTIGQSPSTSYLGILGCPKNWNLPKQPAACGACLICVLVYKPMSYTHRIHGAGIYANMTGVYEWDPCYQYIAAPWIRHGIDTSTISPADWSYVKLIPWAVVQSPSFSRICRSVDQGDSGSQILEHNMARLKGIAVQ